MLCSHRDHPRVGSPGAAATSSWLVPRRSGWRGYSPSASFDRPCSDAPRKALQKSAASVPTPRANPAWEWLEAALPVAARSLTFLLSRIRHRLSGSRPVGWFPLHAPEGDAPRLTGCRQERGGTCPCLGSWPPCVRKRLVSYLMAHELPLVSGSSRSACAGFARGSRALFTQRSTTVRVNEVGGFLPG